MRLGVLSSAAPSMGRKAGQRGGRWVGSTWQNGAFVLSQSRTVQGPFNELFWSGQPAETIFTLMLGLMAKPASKPTAAKGGRGAAACTQGGTGAAGAGMEQEDEWGKEASRLLPLPTSTAKGTDLLLSPPFAFVGGFSPPSAPRPLPLASHTAGAVFAGRGVSPGLSPTPPELLRSQRSPWRGFVRNQTQ